MTGIVSPQQIRTWEMKVPITGFLEGDIKDWPSHIQDAIYSKIESVSHKVGLPLAIVLSRCDVMYDDDGKQDGAFIHVVVSEIVVRDERFTDEAAMKKAFDELVSTGKLNDNKYH